jgi:hypothetical protein
MVEVACFDNIAARIYSGFELAVVFMTSPSRRPT